MSRAARTPASDLLADGWLPPKAAAAALGITEDQLFRRWRRGEIKRRPLAPGVNAFLYDVEGSR